MPYKIPANAYLKDEKLERKKVKIERSNNLDCISS